MWRVYEKVKRLLSLVLIACGAWAPTAAVAKSYLNAEFRMAVEIPRGTATCRRAPAEHDHGINLYLDKGPSGCASLESRRYVGLGGGYNASEEASPEAALGDICHLFGATQMAAPSGLSISGLLSASCRANLPDKVWIDIHVAAQNCDRGDEADINYEATLHTTGEHLEADLVRFRSFLNGVELLTDCAPNPPP